MQAVRTVSVRPHRGSPRIWFQGAVAANAGFLPGCRFSVERVPGAQQVLIRLSPTGERTVSRKTYESGREVPVLDINSREDLELFEGQGLVRVLFQPGQLLLSPLASEQRRQRRLKRLRQRIRQGAPLQTAGVCAGGGVLGHALHAGLAQAGLPSRVAVFNEVREDLTSHAMEHNDSLVRATQTLQLPLQELAFDESVLRELPEVDLVELGLPCSGASVAGRAKRSLSVPEEHPEVGHLVVAALALVARLNPAVCVFENVVPYARTASAALIRRQLKDFGYDVHETEFYGPDFGVLEARRRWCLVALTTGIGLELSGLAPAMTSPLKLAEVLDPPDTPEHRWCAMSGLRAKERRDREAGKGFKLQVFTGNESYIGTLTKGLSKNRTTDPKIQHPEHPGLLRVPSAPEHARCKGVPEHLVRGLTHTKAHELLGQGVTYAPFQALGHRLGRALLAWAAEAEQTVNSRFRGPLKTVG